MPTVLSPVTLVANTPIGVQLQAHGGGPMKAVQLVNSSNATLTVYFSPQLQGAIPANATLTFTDLDTMDSFGGWLVFVPGASGTCTPTTYAGNDQVPSIAWGLAGNELAAPRFGLSRPTWASDRRNLTQNVRDFGAYGDGVLDDTLPFLLAVSAASGGQLGATVYAPAGTYNLSKTIIVPDGVTIRGDGPGASTVFATSATLDVFQMAGTNGHSQIRDLHIAAALASRTAGAGIFVIGAGYDFRIRNVNMDNMFNGVVVGNGSTIPNQIMLADMRLWNCSNYGVLQASAQNLFLHRVMVSNVGVAGLIGFFWTGQNSVWMTDCIAYGMAEGFVVLPTGSNICQYGWFEQCVADTCTTRGWRFDASTAGTIEQMMLKNCWGATGGTDFGLQITSVGGGTARDILLDGFQAFNNQTHGITVLGANTTAVDIRNARVAGNSQLSHNTYNGINIGAGVSSFSITGCRSGNTAGTGFGVIQNAGIFVAAGASNNYLIWGNDLTGNTNGSLIDNGTGTSKTVLGNIGYDPRGQVTAPAFPATTVAAVNNTGNYVTAYIANGTSAITLIQITGISGTYNTTGLQIAASGWGTIRIPPNGGVKFTYAGGAPAWTWFSD